MKLTYIINAIANYGRLLSVIRASLAAGHDVSVIASGSAVISRFAQKGKDVAATIESDLLGSNVRVCRIPSLVEEAPAQSVGMAAISTAGMLGELNPDFVIVIGDRFETQGGVIAAYQQGRCIIHFQGGELSGTLDEGTRHAITQQSHYHVPATEDAARRLVAMGSHPRTILTTGCPGIDLVRNPLAIHEHARTDLLVAFHPNTCDQTEQIRPLLDALDALQQKTIMIWPNADDGSQWIMKDIRRWREEQERPWLTMRRYLHPEDFAAIIASCKCCVGNSSAFVREAVACGTPVVLLGKRQQGRVKAQNVLPTKLDAHDIEQSVRHIQGCKYKSSDKYGGGHTARRFIDALEGIQPYSQKVYYEGVQARPHGDTESGQDPRSDVPQPLQ